MSNFLEWGIREARKWKCYENSNSWNPPHHHYHGEYEYQPSVQEEAWIEAEIEKRFAQKLQEEAFIEAAIQERIAQLLQELQIEENRSKAKEKNKITIHNHRSSPF